MNDAELVEACRAGDRNAFRSLFELHQDRVYSLAMNFCRDSAEAQDITQEVFLKLYQRLRQFKQQASFSTWLHRIVVNTCLNQRRSERRWRPLEESDIGGRSVTGLQEARLQRDEVSRALQLAVSELDPELRLLVLLRYLEGLTYAEISDALERPLGTVSSQLSRAHRLLGERLWNFKDQLR